jgi:uncharacterized protein with FMN-binding domain
MKRRYKVLFVIALILLIMGIGGKLVLNQFERELSAMESIELTEIDLSTIEDGTKTGEYKAGPIKVVIEVEVKDHRIASLELIEHRNGQGKDAESILDAIIKEQTLAVDAVSGATYSSKAIQLAIENALTERK